MSSHNIHFKNRKELSTNLKHIYICKYGKNLGTQKQVRNSHGKRAIGVRTIEVSLYKLTNSIIRNLQHCYTAYENVESRSVISLPLDL